jgi:hypothetical protein
MCTGRELPSLGGMDSGVSGGTIRLFWFGVRGIGGRFEAICSLAAASSSSQMNNLHCGPGYRGHRKTKSPKLAASHEMRSSIIHLLFQLAPVFDCRHTARPPQAQVHTPSAKYASWKFKNWNESVAMTQLIFCFAQLVIFYRKSC